MKNNFFVDRNITKKMKIIIIVPHGYCIPDKIEKRHCDRRALEEAKKLQLIALKKGYDVKLFYSKELREDVDYNRIESFSYPLRMQIRQYLEETKGENVVIFEMHSFPKETESFGKSQVTFLSIPNPRYRRMAKDLSDRLKNTGLIIYNLRGSQKNNLQLETSQSFNVKHFLIEMNEDKEKLTIQESDKFLNSLIDEAAFLYRDSPNLFLGIIVILIIVLVLWILYQGYKLVRFIVYDFKIWKNTREITV